MQCAVMMRPGINLMENVHLPSINKQTDADDDDVKYILNTKTAANFMDYSATCLQTKKNDLKLRNHKS